ncbi:MAG: MauE/DoxX family redox-associated membrane protein [Planctomycetota bacterium]|jgi:hypothetical protein
MATLSFQDLRARMRTWDWKYILSTTAGCFLGAVLLFAVWAKVINPIYFQEWVEFEGLDFLLPATIMAPFSLAVEGILGMALLLGMRRLWVLIPTGLLVLFFLFLTGKAYLAYLTGSDAGGGSCGCFGNLIIRSPGEAFWQDVILLIPALFIAFLWRPPTGGPVPKVRVTILGVFVVGLLVVYRFAPELPFDDMATRLRADTPLDELCVGLDEDRVCISTLFPELAEGEHLVVIADVNDEAFGESVADLSEYAINGVGPMLWAVSPTSEEDIGIFFWTWAPSFEVRPAPLALLRPMYRRLPRSFAVRDGTVTETFDGLPPLADFAPVEQPD